MIYLTYVNLLDWGDNTISVFGFWIMKPDDIQKYGFWIMKVDHT